MIPAALQWASYAIIGAGILVILAIDLVLLVRYGPRETISFKIRKASQRYLMIPFIVGFSMGLLGGHWWNILPLGGCQ